MEGPKHNDTNAKARAIIDDAIAELYLLGMESRDDAAELMAIQAIVRIESKARTAKVAKFADEMCGDD